MSNHWYSAEGQSRHKRANGKAVTLRDARKENLYPSVTTVLRVLTKSALEKWRVEQAIKAGLERGRALGPVQEVDQETIDQVSDTLETGFAQARDFGDAFHKVAEYVNVNGTTPPLMSAVSRGWPRIHEWAEKFHKWQQENIAEVISTEAVIVNKEVGYAGRNDLVARHKKYGIIVIDFKTQRVRNGKPAFYDEWIYQLAPYRKAQPKSDIHGCMSLVIDSVAPSDPVEHLWSEEDSEHGWEVFQKVVALWQAINKYKPTA